MIEDGYADTELEMEVVMRAIGALLLAMSTFLAAPNARAQAYDPAYPVCQQSYGIGGTSISCSFTSLAQCQATASGRAAQCLTNPYFNFSKTRRP
jgi:uncharacterized protein DUF3551